MSSVAGRGVREVLGSIARLVAEARVAPEPEPSEIVLRPDLEGTRVEVLGPNEYRLHGRDVERAVALNDVTIPDALDYIEDRLRGLGVPRLLARSGADEGATIHIASFTFTYTPE
jgi:GTP-binding protein